MRKKSSSSLHAPGGGGGGGGRRGRVKERRVHIVIRQLSSEVTCLKLILKAVYFCFLGSRNNEDYIAKLGGTKTETAKATNTNVKKLAYNSSISFRG